MFGINGKSMLNLAAAAAVFAGSQATASNGYFSHGYGPIAKSMAGACVALVENAMCGAHNPASLGFLDDRWEVGVALFSPDRGFQANDDFQSPPYTFVPPGQFESDNDLFLIPHFAYNRRLDPSTSVGVILGGNGGMNTKYDDNIFRNFASPGAPPQYQASSPTGMDLIQMFVGFNYARQLNDEHAVAVMPVLAIQRLEVEGLEPLRGVSLHPDRVTNNGQDWSWGGGARVGWLWQPTDALNIGASYQTKLWMSKFDKYEGLLADEGSFDVPPVLDLGFAYDFTPAWTLSFNYQRIWFEDIKALSNPADLPLMPGDIALGPDDGLGFGWKDQDIYKIGLRWKFSPDLTLRAGFSQGSQVVPNSQALFGILAPAVVRQHYTFGFSKALASDNEFHASFMYAPEEEVHGQNPNTGPQTGLLYMSQWEVELGWVFKL